MNAQPDKSAPSHKDFFGLLRWIEGQNPDWKRIACTTDPAQDLVRFGQPPGLNFAPRTLEPIRWVGERPKVDVHFFGLLGPNGPMPAYLTEFIRDRLRNSRDPTLSEFFDIFHQRFLSFFYRAWQVNQKAADWDRPKESKYVTFFGSFFGMAEPSLRHRDSVPDQAKLYFTGHLARQPRNVDGLESILADYFLIPIEIETLPGHWMPLPPECHCRLGQAPENATLGASPVLGARIWDTQNRFCIKAGPLSWEKFHALLPDGPSYHCFSDWVQFYTNGAFAWDLQLVLDKEETPGTCLGLQGKLGWTTWVLSQTPEEDADDLVLSFAGNGTFS